MTTKAKKERTFVLRLTYAQLEALLPATHSTTAELLIGPDDDDSICDRCAEVREKVSALLNEIDARAATQP